MTGRGLSRSQTKRRSLGVGDARVILFSVSELSASSFFQNQGGFEYHSCGRPPRFTSLPIAAAPILSMPDRPGLLNLAPQRATNSVAAHRREGLP
jgi:hypothetical protein